MGGFKSHISSNYTLLQNGTEHDLIRIKGNNGAGKSTILQAIAFVLYGHMYNVFSHQMAQGAGQADAKLKKFECWVELILPQLSIKRQKRPDRLIVIDSQGRNWENHAAQGISQDNPVCVLIP